MKLERFDKIHGHRIFKKFSWPSTLENFGRFNLIYGWNGSGKTTLSGLMKSIQIASSVTEGRVEFIFDSNRIIGADLSKASILPMVRVFNRETASRSVFETKGETLGQLPPVYVFGEESAEKQRQIDELKLKLQGLIETLNLNLTEVSKTSTALTTYEKGRAREIKNLLVTPGGTFNNYDAGDFRTRIARLETNPISVLSLEE